MEYNNPFIDTYKNYISKGWYGDAISSQKLSRWCENFKKIDPSQSIDPKICAHFLLNSLIFYQPKQLEAIILSIENKIKSNINRIYETKTGHRLSEIELANYCDEYNKQSCIIAATKPDVVGDSAHYVSRLWRNTVAIETSSVSELKKVIVEKGKTHIFFVDDFIGTGTKMNTFLNDNLFATTESHGFKKVNDIISDYQDSVDFNIAVFALHEQGQTYLSHRYPSLNFYYGDKYNNEYNLISNSCTLFDIFSKEKTEIINYLQLMQTKLDPENPYALNLPLSFQHGCPNNSLSLYYKTNSDWYGLLKESHPTTK